MPSCIYFRMALTNYYGSIEDRKNYLTDNTFDNGDNLKFCLKDSKIMGSIGIVTSEISVKSEGYITEITILDKSQKIFKEMLNNALAVCRNNDLLLHRLSKWNISIY